MIDWEAEIHEAQTNGQANECCRKYLDMAEQINAELEAARSALDSPRAALKQATKEGYEAGVKDAAKLLMSDHSINDSQCANGNCEHIELSDWILKILDGELEEAKTKIV